MHICMHTHNNTTIHTHWCAYTYQQRPYIHIYMHTRITQLRNSWICWGEDTWVFVRVHLGKAVAEPRRLRDVRVGDHVRTPRGYRQVQRKWRSDYRSASRDTYIVRCEGEGEGYIVRCEGWFGWWILYDGASGGWGEGYIVRWCEGGWGERYYVVVRGFG